MSYANSRSASSASHAPPTPSCTGNGKSISRLSLQFPSLGYFLASFRLWLYLWALPQGGIVLHPTDSIGFNCYKRALLLGGPQGCKIAFQRNRGKKHI